MVYADPKTADVPALADYAARWLHGLRDWCPRCQGTGREDPRDGKSPNGSCPRCLGKLWVSAVDVERLLEAIASLGPLSVEVNYDDAGGARRCLLRLHGDHHGEDDTTVGAVYRAAAELVAALLARGVLKDTPFDDTGH